MRKVVKMTRGYRRTFAKKANMSLGSVRHTFARGGGYL